MISTRAIACKDHLGNEFNSQLEMCAYWRVLESTYISRIKRGLTLDKALTLKTNRVEVEDHLGNKYNTLGKMCSHYNLGVDTVRERLLRGWSLEKALTEPVLITTTTFEVRDFNGKTFKSLSSMCAYYGVSRTLYTYRIKQGWTQRDALTIESYHSKGGCLQGE